MIHFLTAILLLCLPALCAAERIGITITGPSQQLTVEKKSTVITPETVTVNAQVNVTGTEILTIAVPGPQGIPGSGSSGGPVQWADVQSKPSTFAPSAHTQAASTITGLATVAVSNSYGDLSNKPTIPSGAEQIAYNAGTVKDALDQLLYVPIGINSFTLDSGGNITREIGSSYTVGTLAWSTNKTATSQTINGTPRTSPYSVNATVSTNQTYALQVGDGQTTATSSRTVTFTHQRYWGVSSSAAIDDAGIIALAKEFSTSRGQTRTFTPVDQYIYVAYLTTGGDAAFTVNGFLDDSWQLVQRQFINSSGYSAEFRIYRSANRLTGTFSVVVS
ncbi:hypothetical protein KI809_18770 [Geobacter pelophilus]|uniref:Uncharacterized protein n=1 Tax=Geoanaerobacter pelophilus TaxID=60036 RepID=A0AAW4LGS6_9BACT|nr:hypothetical protein [Geoanaerobacter pelophilus]MBT0666356.1 hypothetical protein [Geoanaerobacter pelophilus]